MSVNLEIMPEVGSPVRTNSFYKTGKSTDLDNDPKLKLMLE